MRRTSSFWGGPLSNWHVGRNYSSERAFKLLLPRLAELEIAHPAPEAFSSCLLRAAESGCGEQWIMAMKGRLFERDVELLEKVFAEGEDAGQEFEALRTETLDPPQPPMSYMKKRALYDSCLRKCLRSKSPKEQKGYGRKCRNFDLKVWDMACIPVVVSCQIARAGADDVLRRLYTRCGKRVFVEGSPTDTVWGVRLRMRVIGKGQTDWGYAMGLRVRRYEHGGRRRWGSGGIDLKPEGTLRGVAWHLQPFRFDLEKLHARHTPHLTISSTRRPSVAKQTCNLSELLRACLKQAHTCLKMAPRTDFPPVRACIFDMDGLLIDSEDAYSFVTNQILRENNRPDLPWRIKAQLQGRPGPAASRIFHEWAQLPITDAQFLARQRELQAEAFKHCKPLPGVEWMLKTLGEQGQMAGGQKVHLALATSSHTGNYEIKTKGMKEMFKVFPESCIITGDDQRIPRGRGKPLPDIYLLALKLVNEGLENGEKGVLPEECLVFEDSVPGVEAGRRAGMRVVWCPHPGLLGEYQGREKEVLAGRTGAHSDEEMIENAGTSLLAGSPGHVGEIDDGWAEMVLSLENFDFKKYGINIVEPRYRTESGQSATPGTTDRELEEMTAIADGKGHAPEEGSRFGNGHL